ncbi:MAG: hypothetical protein A2Z21_04995 [Candidatus Fraserbacteria bacterium RBG_16_55_9]|uniref:Phage head morphogenesis domain-containing protein n=1 Tax=Fraserbacteria sp. (strain RBG_16_55_9) TaxID=1817864 RepID=A0A1F5UPR4_FRAXR|nr:MAG: hypothetical protein A2Z21_04995 [Candidatus Fraserbacteria bacterium RBG_16_55_9]
MGIRIPHYFHRWKGQSPFYQYYATVHSLTCEVCLGHHGEVYEHSGDSPELPLHANCRCTLLEFPARELPLYRERGLCMKEKATRELQRRRRFSQARETLPRQAPGDAILLFQQAVDVDIYLEEIETLCREHGESLRHSPELALKLQDLFLKAYRRKFEAEKYQPMAEGMKYAQRAHGLHVIQELFQEFTRGPRGL